MDKKVILTVQGVENIKAELDQLVKIGLPDAEQKLTMAIQNDGDVKDATAYRDFCRDRIANLGEMLCSAKVVGKFESIKVGLKKKGAHTLERSESGVWTLDGVKIDQERAVQELAEAVSDLGYWCQVAKDVLPTEMFEMVQESYAYHED